MEPEQKVRIHYIHRLTQRSRERVVGIFVLLALAILITLIFVNSRTSHFFEKKIYYVVYLSNAQGISTESMVNLSGIEVGRVNTIEVSEDHRIKITLFVYDRYRDLVRSDSRAAMSKLSVLGKATIDISAGSPQQPLLQSGATLPIDEPLSIDELIARFTPVVEKLEQIVDSTAAIAAAIDPKEVKGMTGDLAATAKNLRAITEQVASGKGAVGQLLYQRETAQQLANSIKSLESVMARADQRLAEMEPLTKELTGMAKEGRQLANQMNGTVSSVNVELQQLPELVNRMQTLMDETNRTLEGLQNVWPLSSSMPQGERQMVIEAQPAK